MNFDQKLNALMHLFKISNSKLSRGIGVDASLISRWKSGERKISPNSPHIPMLASYFLKLNAYHYQREYLDKIIAARQADQQANDETQRVHVLADWLISADPPDPQPDEQPEQLAQSLSLIANITDILTGVGISSSESDIRAAANKRMALLPGRSLRYEVFEGRSGRRQAILDALNQVLKSSEKHEIFMTSEDDNRWVSEDTNFYNLWTQLLRKIVEKGHQITLIHVVNRRVNEIMAMLSYWMPLHMSGRMNSYYYPRYGDRRIRQTFLIVKGESALFSNTIGDFSGNDLTYRFDDPVTVEQNMRLFMVHLSQCRPLFNIFKRDGIKAFFEQHSELNKKAGATFSIQHHFNSRLLPFEIMKTRLLTLPVVSNDVKILDLLENHQNEFFARLEHEMFIDIIPFSLLEMIEELGFCTLATDVFPDFPIKLNKVDSLAWLKNIVAALAKYPNYELFFGPESLRIEDLKVSVTYKESSMAMFSPLGKSKNPASVIVLCENNVLHSLSYYFDDFIQQIPSSLRNRHDVIARLERLISVLSGEAVESLS